MMKAKVLGGAIQVPGCAWFAKYPLYERSLSAILCTLEEQFDGRWTSSETNFGREPLRKSRSSGTDGGPQNTGECIRPVLYVRFVLGFDHHACERLGSRIPQPPRALSFPKSGSACCRSLQISGKRFELVAWTSPAHSQSSGEISSGRPRGYRADQRAQRARRS